MTGSMSSTPCQSSLHSCPVLSMGKKKPDRMAMEQGFELTTCSTKLSLAHSGRRQKKKRLQIEGHWPPLIPLHTERHLCGHCSVGLQRASGIAHEQKHYLSGLSDNLNLILGTHRVQKTDSCKLSTNLHLCAHAYMHNPPKQNKNQITAGRGGARL